MIKGIIFDLDGTTIDTLQDIQDSLNKALQEYGFKPRTYDEVRKGVGTGYLNLVKYSIDKDIDQDKIIEIANRYLNIYSDNNDIKTKPFEGIKELLETLQDKGIKIAINSNKSDKNTKKLINKYFPGINFNMILGAQKDIKHKPDPQGALLILQNMNLSNEEVLYVGDSETDVQTGRNAKLKTVGCAWGYRGEEVLKKENSDFIIYKAAELLDIINKLNN